MREYYFLLNLCKRTELGYYEEFLKAKTYIFFLLS